VNVGDRGYFQQLSVIIEDRDDSGPFPRVPVRYAATNTTEWIAADSVNPCWAAGWRPIAHSEVEGDQEKDLTDGYWADIGPDGRPGHPWSWTILRGGDSDEHGGGPAADEEAAKVAVEKWATENIPGWE
jgi:hypothetical protein